MPEVLTVAAASCSLGVRVQEHHSGVMSVVRHRRSIQHGCLIVGRAPCAGYAQHRFLAWRRRLARRRAGGRQRGPGLSCAWVSAWRRRSAHEAHNLIDVLIAGWLIGTPVARTAHNGNESETARLHVVGADGESVLVRLTAFATPACPALAIAAPQVPT